MTLLEILLHELESWPEGKEYAYQSSTSRMAFFASSPMDDAIKSVILSRDSSNRGPHNKVTREEWQTAKIKSLAFFPEVAAILGEERAVKELLAVGKINYKAEELDEAFAFVSSPQGHEFWTEIAEPNREGKEGKEQNREVEGLKQALELIMAAINPDHYLQLHPDGSGYVSDANDANDILTFHNTDDLVEKYLSPPPPKFEHWDLIQDRFKWVAKDSDGNWWAYVKKPILNLDQWENEHECSSLEILKIDIPCHWSRSLIERPSH